MLPRLTLEISVLLIIRKKQITAPPFLNMEVITYIVVQQLVSGARGRPCSPSLENSLHPSRPMLLSTKRPLNKP